jgi:SH3-like domain-containing protein
MKIKIGLLVSCTLISFISAQTPNIAFITQEAEPPLFHHQAEPGYESNMLITRTQVPSGYEIHKALPWMSNNIKQVTANRRTCQLSAYAKDRDPAGLNIRSSPSPNGQIMRNIPSFTEAPIIDIVAAQGNWVQINQVEGESGMIFQGRGWLYTPMLAISTRGYETRGISVYASPNNRSRVLGRIPPEVEVKLLSCDGQWAYISYQRIQGWLKHIDQCPNPSTSCP